MVLNSLFLVQFQGEGSFLVVLGNHTLLGKVLRSPEYTANIQYTEFPLARASPTPPEIG